MEKMTTQRKIAGIVGLAACIVGAVGWWGAVHSSPDVLELTESAQWGLLVGMFFFFEAFGSGFLLVGALRRHAGAALVGVAGIMGACIMVLMDLYHPIAAWRLFLMPNVGSPMFLDVLFSALCIVFGGMLVVALRKDMPGLVRVARVLTAVVAVLFPLGTAWLCTTLPGQMGWSVLELAAFFVAVGVCAGGAMVVFRMEKGRAFFVAALVGMLILGAADCGFLLYGTDESLSLLTLREVILGSYAPLFWGTQALLLAALVCAGFSHKVDGRVAVGMGLIGVALSKYLFAVKGNLFPYLSLPDIEVQLLNASSLGYPMTSYFPHASEWLACIGVVGLVAAIVAWALPCAKERA